MDGRREEERRLPRSGEGSRVDRYVCYRPLSLRLSSPPCPFEYGHPFSTLRRWLFAPFPPFSLLSLSLSSIVLSPFSFASPVKERNEIPHGFRV